MSGRQSGSSFLREREIFLEVVEQTSKEARDAVLDRATNGDPVLRSSVEALLSNHKDDQFLESPISEPPDAAALPQFAGEERIGEYIGRYKLLEKIGEGGCGTVYLADQQEPVRRQVALKVIKLGMDTKSVVARFEAERQALALMDHPNIARVLDGGATNTGRPYFVMELVRGVRITEFCRSNGLKLRNRIDLFIQLCFAIQHAHQKGIIHRDIKPSNVLVSSQDGRPHLKVIDFGIAKAITEPLTDQTVFTNFHAFIGTPVYTSPEQAQMASADVDTRSDIYSLGVLLYELLTGVTPFDPKELTRSGLTEMCRIIREEDPEAPSVRRSKLPRALGQGGGPGKAVDVAGNLSVPIDVDIDWIIMKCLEKDRARRYSTAQELAQDLERYLNHEPVLARPPSRIYTLQKSLRRHRVVVAAAAAVFVTLVTGASFSIWQAVRATRAEHEAERSGAREASLRKKAEREREHALANQRRAELNEYIADINLADQSIASGNLARALDLLGKHNGKGKEDLKGFEWRYLWKLAQGNDHWILAQESSSVLSLAPSYDGGFLAVGLRDSVNVYDLSTSERVKSFSNSGGSVGFSPQGFLANVTPGAVRLLQMPDGSEALSLPDHFGPVAFSADGTMLATSTRQGVSIQNASNGRLVVLLEKALSPFAFSPIDDSFVSDSRDGVVIWDIATGGQRFMDSSTRIFGGWNRDKRVLQFSPDGRYIVAARSGFRSPGVALEVWASDSGEHIASIPGEREAAEHSGLISGIAFSRDGKLATSSWDHSLRLWDLEERRVVQRFFGNLSEVWALAFTQDGQHIISGGKDGTVALWPVSKSRKENAFPGGWTPIGFSRDGTSLALLKQDAVGFMNLKTHEVEREYPLKPVPRRRGPRNPFVSWQISNDLRFLLEPVEDGVRLRDLTKNETADFLIPDGRVDSIALSPSGDTIIAANRGEGLYWWKIRTPTEPVRKTQGDRAIFSADGKVLLAVSGSGFQVWDVQHDTILTNISTAVSTRFGIALSHDGQILAAASDPQDVENAINLLETRTGRLIGTCSGHTQGIGRLAFSPDGKTLASTSSDTTLRVWNVASQQQLLAIQPGAGPFFDLIFSPDGTHLVAQIGGAPGLQFFEAPPAERGRRE